MPTLYFTLIYPEENLVTQNIIRECQLSLDAKCLRFEDVVELSENTIRNNISLCDALIIVIEKVKPSFEWESLPVDESILNERVRLEISTAIYLDRLIIPFLVDGALLPKRENLQDTLTHLCDCKSYPLRSAFLQEDMEEALDDIQEELVFKKGVEEKMSQSFEESFLRFSNYDAKPDKSSNLESSGAFELRRVVESETIFLKKARGIGDKKGEKNALSALGLAYSRLGQTLKAIDFFLQELDIAKKFGDKEDQCNLMANLGDAYAIAGKVSQAQIYFEEQKTLAKEMGYISLVGCAYNGLGFTYVKQNKIEKAIYCYLKALASYRKQKDHDKELELLVGIGLNYQKLRKWKQAKIIFIQALTTAKYVENRKEETHILIDLAETYCQLGDIESLKPTLNQAEEILNARNASWATPLKNRVDVLKNSPHLNE
jgi:tetratricopeptide (TPR) repeat protein